MLTISTREFQLHSKKYIGMLQSKIVDCIALTKHNKPVARLYTADSENVNKDKEIVNKSIKEEIKPIKGGKILEEDDNGNNVEWTWEWCKANVSHDFTAGKLYKCYMVTYKDRDDNIGVLNGKRYDHVYICKDCLAKLESEMGEGGFNYEG